MAIFTDKLGRRYTNDKQILILGHRVMSDNGYGWYGHIEGFNIHGSVTVRWEGNSNPPEPSDNHVNSHSPSGLYYQIVKPVVVIIK